MDNAKLAKQVEADWPLRLGKKEYIACLKGKELSYKEQALAQHYVCSGGWEGETWDCHSKVCPMYTSHPYKDKVNKKTSNKPKKVLSEEHKAKLKAGREKKTKETK